VNPRARVHDRRLRVARNRLGMRTIRQTGAKIGRMRAVIKSTPAVREHPGAGPQESECAVDNPSVAQSPALSIPEDHAKLLEAARAALRYLDDLDRHAPEGFCMGGEGRVRKQLREAVRRCSFEMRPCDACDGGVTHAPVSHPMERPRMVPCLECGGSGERKVYSYGRPKRGK